MKDIVPFRKSGHIFWSHGHQQFRFVVT